MAAIRRRRLAEPTREPRVDSHDHHCYALVSQDARRTYVGYTIDYARRLRQHNGEISGGAAATRRPHGGAWDFLFVVCVQDAAQPAEPRFGAHEGLSLEWHLKNGGGGGGDRRRRGRRPQHPRAGPIDARLARLAEALALPKFAAFAARFVVLARPSHVDAVWAALVDRLPFACCVLVLEDEL